MSRSAAVTSCLLLAVAPLILAQVQPVTYIYDELGRLVGVVDPNGESATYAYDASGNLLSIARRPAGQVSVVEFTPNGGPVSTVVTVHGTAFSATPGQNTVRFNGLTATVSSSTTTRIVATVPAGATTGPISVTSPSGTASSSASFSVGPSTAPTITGFTPSVGVAGTAVTISGSNFDVTPGNDKVQFNVRPATLTSATSSTIGASVPPNGTSGRLSVETWLGKAVSASDFFIPPPGFVAADVAFTGRMTMGNTAALTIGAPSRIGLMLFDGLLDHRFSLKVDNSTIGLSSATIIRPNTGTLVFQAPLTPNGFIDATELPDAGTYTILIDPLSSFSGSMNLTLYDVPPDLTGPITPGGSAQTVTLSTPGQNALLAFSGLTGQRVSLRGTNGTAGLLNQISLKNPDGTTLVGPMSFVPNGFVDTTSLPVAGTYTLLVDPFKDDTGSSTLTLYDVPADYTVNTIIGNPPVLVPLGTPGQNGAVTFNANSLWMGGHVTVHATNNNLSTVTVKLLSPTGAVMASTTSATPNFDLASAIFTTPGAHLVVVDPFSFNTGQVNINVTAVPPGQE